jgi:hypothetical protein
MTCKKNIVPDNLTKGLGTMRDNDRDSVRTLFKSEISVHLYSATNMQDETKDGKKLPPGEIGVLT